MRSIHFNVCVRFWPLDRVGRRRIAAMRFGFKPHTTNNPQMSPVFLRYVVTFEKRKVEREENHILSMLEDEK